MCFHCENGNPHNHIPTEIREVRRLICTRICTTCDKPLTPEQIVGTSPHWCRNRYVFINPNYNPPEPEIPRGYHKKEIKRGTFGEVSKIREELEELEDAAEQGVGIMVACELSDLYGALRAYAESLGYRMVDLERMADVSKRVFESGHRKSRN